MKTAALYLGIAMVATAGLVLLSTRRTKRVKNVKLSIEKLQEQFKSLDAL